MNKKMICFLTGRILFVEALLLLFPLMVSFIYREDFNHKLSYLLTIAILVIVSIITFKNKPKDMSMRPVDGFIVVSLSWILLSFFGAMPFYFSGEIKDFIDAFFETSSGFTTTGSSILEDVEAMSKSHLFWRSFTHLIGGMGILVFALAISPPSDKEELGSTFIMKAEIPGPVFGKLVSKMKDTARILYIIYLAMTAIVVILLVIAGMPIFDAILHAMGTAGTGGFGIKANSVAYYDSAAIDIIIAVGMMLFGVNFTLYYMLLKGQKKAVFENDELKLYLAIMFAATALIVVNIAFQGEGFSNSLILDAFFQVSSIMTTTGFSTVNFDTWPTFSKVILDILMFIGGCAGSTAGGLKVTRVGILFKSMKAEIHTVLQPNRVKSIRFNGKILEKNVIRGILNYFAIYITIFISLVTIVSLETSDFTTAFSAVAATFNNIGPGLAAVGPLENFSLLSRPMTLLLSFAMIAGRLEIYPILFLIHSIIGREKI